MGVPLVPRVGLSIHTAAGIRRRPVSIAIPNAILTSDSFVPVAIGNAD